MSMGGRVIPIRSMYGIFTYIHHIPIPWIPWDQTTASCCAFKYMAMFFEDSTKAAFRDFERMMVIKIYPPTPMGKRDILHNRN